MPAKLPFDMPHHLLAKLPPRSRDGFVYADVKYRGIWNGIPAIDSEQKCVGVYCGRRILVWPLPFTPEEIEDVRPPCLWNRLLANLPAALDLYTCSLVAIWVVCPILLACGLAITPWMLLATPPIAVLSIAVMYSGGSFPFTRLPTAIAGIGFSLVAINGFIGSVIRLLSASP
jgi:hypothetical protein